MYKSNGTFDIVDDGWMTHVTKISKQVHIFIRINSIFTLTISKQSFKYDESSSRPWDWNSSQLSNITNRKILDNLLKDYNLEIQCYNPSRNANSDLKQSKYSSHSLILLSFSVTSRRCQSKSNFHYCCFAIPAVKLINR